MCLCSGQPTTARGVDLTLNEALHWFSLLQSTDGPFEEILSSSVTDFDFRVVSYAQVSLIILRFRESLPLTYTDSGVLDRRDLVESERKLWSLIEEYDGELGRWADNWHAGIGVCS